MYYYWVTCSASCSRFEPFVLAPVTMQSGNPVTAIPYIAVHVTVLRLTALCYTQYCTTVPELSLESREEWRTMHLSRPASLICTGPSPAIVLTRSRCTHTHVHTCTPLTHIHDTCTSTHIHHTSTTLHYACTHSRHQPTYTFVAL
jgi:hypothetical protein